ncbi:MAG: beta-ketoacyl-ACP synthase III [Clostridiaceae bacterium]
MSFRILGTGKAEPDFILDNEMLSKMVDTSDEWIVQRTGIKERRILNNEENMTSLSLKAAKEALLDSGVEASELDLIIFATMRGDYSTPAQACILASDLGAHCPAFDVNAACTGFLYAMDIADSYFKSGKVNKVLVVGMELMSRYIDFTDRRTCVLFGDGGGAAVLGKGNELKAIHLSAEGNIPALKIENKFDSTPFKTEVEPESSKVIMDGKAVYRFAVGALEGELNTCLESAGLTTEDIDLVIPHQANSRIIESARERLKMPSEKFANRIHKRGNASAGSIPLLLDDLNKEGLLKNGMTIAMVAFGGGLTSGGMIIEWNK